MRRHAVMITVLLALTISSIAVSSAYGQSKNIASDIGVSPTTIRIAVIADVDNPFSPGILQGMVDGVQGAGKFINATGGIAGRKVQVDFIDSHLNANDARNAIITACQQDFALVGTAALLLPSVDDAVNCKDAKGKVTGIPDLGGFNTGIAEACAPTSFPITPAAVDCGTLTKPEQTFRQNVGSTKYLLRSSGGDLHGPVVVANDTKAFETTERAFAQGIGVAGVNVDHIWPMASTAQQSAYTPVIQDMKTTSANYALGLQPVSGFVQQRQEAELQGLTDPKLIWECSVACYSDPTFEQAGAAVDRTMMTLYFLPFNETRANKMTRNFVKYVGKDKLNGFASWGFTAGLLFREAAETAAKNGGNNGLTRADVLEALRATHHFNAGGMVGTVDIGNKVPTPCFVLVQYRGSTYVRVHPKRPGTFDCKKSNMISFQNDLLTK